MAQISAGTANVTNGNNVVQLPGANLSAVAVGHAFHVRGIDAVYSIIAAAPAASPPTVTLSVNYAGITASDVPFVITTGFSPVSSLYEPDPGDVDIPMLLKHRLVRAIDGLLNNNDKVRLMPSGGVAIRMVNKTGAASVKGTVVTLDTTVDNGVVKIVVNVPSPIGVIYEDGIADGSEVWVVTSGKAEVYFIGSTTRGHLARGFVTSDSGYVPGQALSEAIPTSPFATDKHFYEIGHVSSARTGAGLAWVVLHFN